MEVVIDKRQLLKTILKAGNEGPRLQNWGVTFSKKGLERFVNDTLSFINTVCELYVYVFPLTNFSCLKPREEETA